MSSDAMIFLGKLAFSSASGGSQDPSWISLHAATNTLVVTQASSPQAAQSLNAYGESNQSFWLQASNGLYIVYSGSAYQATESRTGSPICFSCEKVDGGLLLVDNGPDQSGSTPYYVTIENDQLTRVNKSQGTSGITVFAQVDISPGLTQIKQQRYVQGMDFSWAYLAAADLSHCNFSGSDLSNADLSSTVLYQAYFQGTETNLSGADFTLANMDHVYMQTANLQQANLSSATLTYAQLSNADLTGATLAGANLTQAYLIGTNFAQANLSTANLTTAIVNTIQIPGTSLMGATLSHLDLTTAVIDKQTNFASATMQNVNLTGLNLQEVNFTHADLTGAKLDGTNLTGAEMSYVNLTNATLTQGVTLYSASLSNATLQGANLTGAQLGAKQESFQLTSDCAASLDNDVISDEIRQQFQAAGHPLSQAATLQVRVPGANWVITDQQTIYTITKATTGLPVWMYLSTNNAAVLSGAYMPNAVFTDANLYAVNLAGVQWYGDQAKADNADLEEADLANANLSSMDFSQARMYGCTLDYAYLIDSNLSGALLSSSINKKQTSLAYASLQGTNFTEAKLSDAVLSNAAVSLDEGPFFTAPTSDATALDQLTIPQDILVQFQACNLPLESNATVTLNIPGLSWTIKNGSNQLYPVYNIANFGTALYVSGGPIGVHLFDMAASLSTDLDNRNLSSDVQAAFQAKGYPLVASASVQDVIIPGQKWLVDNTDSSTSTLQSGYVQFYVLLEKGLLNVFGSTLSVVRIGDNQTLEAFRYALATTQVAPNIMNNATTCPNGQKLQVYLNQTQQKLTWEQMMTANTPPVPPACVPSPFSWCSN
ncbi:pentapeptide repeat-containing protein [Tumebacillus permanentifrigoris]|uniref:Uncharacterized protein YjbI with pentapeptide repeats n=1 Tax=Tumebacillus permanentifrigoris TaxID=378543 RepID=A0A316D7A1_9BACL|nr:pentapeptide repeat-containing protein [Tumebacillus permanentifrigoris]PWK11604.1 uncharacterized protein YjbI with pentapeptide repeats [Tumebacillus permanentifrigoris]